MSLNKKTINNTNFLILIIFLGGIYYYFLGKKESPSLTIKNSTASIELNSKSSNKLINKNNEPSYKPTLPPDSGELQNLAKDLPSEKKPKSSTPLFKTIFSYNSHYTRIYENRLKELFKNSNQEGLMEYYFQLKQERAKKLAILLTSNKVNRTSIMKINYEYQNLIYAKLGKELYIKYLQELKTINTEAKSSKIIFEF